VQIGGDAISKKAWKKGVSQIADGDKKKVLAVNRTGKFNWMDPTPRFVEPGKTTTFTVELGSALSAAEEQTLALKLKLLGTGKSSKMWYTLGGATTEFDWQLEPEEFEAQWSADVDTTFSVSFRAYEDGGKTHVEYSVTHEP
ncbi:MAG: hypothetical protein KTR33_07915, partial [Gammaproteobacteria bacterium]|nr:hypothetical protein [Gammaproteobacteria bacterium]